MTTTYEPVAVYRVHEADFLLSLGTAWPEICRQLERTPCALSRLFYRAGRPDLASSLTRAVGSHAVRNSRCWELSAPRVTINTTHSERNPS